MEIKASCKLNKDVAKAAIHLVGYKTVKPQKAFRRRLIGGVLLALFVILAIIITEFSTLTFVSLLLTLLYFGLICFFHFVVPKKEYKQYEKVGFPTNEYTFLDDSFRVVTTGEMHRSESEGQYAMIKKVMETSTYFFLFYNEPMCFVVDKSTIQDGTAWDIREKLMRTAGEYIICDY